MQDSIKGHAFRLFLFGALTGLFIHLQFFATPHQSPEAEMQPSLGAVPQQTLLLFYHPDCPHCHEAITYLERHSETFPPFHPLDITSPEGNHLLTVVMTSFKIPVHEISVPLFVYDNTYRMGFGEPGDSGPALKQWIATATPASTRSDTHITLPLFGAIDPADYSLPALTILMGLADGFNPCAMWVLLYLISIVAGLGDRRKIWWLVGSFVLASGILYYLFMTAWLNTFLFVGYSRTLTLLIGLTAIGFGADHLYRLIRDRGVVTCEIGDMASRQQTMGRVERLVKAPVGLASLTGIVGLAFAVNAIEFLCSAALPAIYTHTLSLMELSAATYYLYILLYVVVFMLDDLVIFALAALTVQKILDSRYAAWSRAIGGIILLGLGGWMIWK